MGHKDNKRKKKQSKIQSFCTLAFQANKRTITSGHTPLNLQRSEAEEIKKNLPILM